jgi:hypothetical protein
MKKNIAFVFIVLAVLNSCSTTPPVSIEPELEYPPIEKWLTYYEKGQISREEFLCLIQGGFDVKKMETLKFIYINRDKTGGMYKLARKTKIKVDEEIRNERASIE